MSQPLYATSALSSMRPVVGAVRTGRNRPPLCGRSPCCQTVETASRMLPSASCTSPSPRKPSSSTAPSGASTGASPVIRSHAHSSVRPKACPRRIGRKAARSSSANGIGSAERITSASSSAIVR